MKIVLAAVDKPLANAWKDACADLDFITVHHGSILDIRCDAVVSPANSFGFMDGGIDALYSEHFGWDVQDRLQQLIRDKHNGELLVGTAEIVDTENAQIPFVIAAPTMRVPMTLSETVNPYLAARAVLLLIKNGIFSSGIRKGERISQIVKSVAFPGLGTGTGDVPPTVCARQVRAAIDEIILGRQEFPGTWTDALKRHQKMQSDKVRDLRFEDLRERT